MSILGPEIAQSIRATCEAHVAESAAALARAFHVSFDVQVGQLDDFAGTIPPSLSGPGLGVLFQVGDQGVLLFIPEQGGWLPDGYVAPGALDDARYQTLAVDLGAVLLPESAMPTESRCLKIVGLEQSLRDGQMANEAKSISLKINCDGGITDACLIWPLAAPQQLAPSQGSAAAASPHADRTANAAAASANNHSASDQSASDPSVKNPAHATNPNAAPGPQASFAHSPQKLFRYRDLEDGLRLLPDYARSLLKIPVGVVVVLAETKKTVAKIREICPGMIIQVGKGCDEMLQLEVGGCPIAIGEAVKVGDKFGLRLTAMSMPRPRFESVRGRGKREGSS